MARSTAARRFARRTGSILCSALGCACILLVAPFFYSFVGIIECQRCLKRQGRKGSRVYLKSESNHPLPLPLQRHFNLSDPNISLSSQSNSRLMNLPHPVREIIWTHALADAIALNIDRDPKSLRLHSTVRSCQCTNGSEEECEHYIQARIDAILSLCDLRDDTNVNADLKRTPGGTKPALAAAKTCRQAYQECIPLLYARNTFRFSMSENVAFFTQGIRHQHAARLRLLSLNVRVCAPADVLAWTNAWFHIATWMPGLVWLEVDLGIKSVLLATENLLLPAIMQVSGLKHFKLRIRYFCDVPELTNEILANRKRIETLVKRPRGVPLEQIGSAGILSTGE